MTEKDDFVYAPVLVPTLNRYDHFVRLVESLQRCKYADRTELVIGLDYPPSPKYVDGYNKIKDYISAGIDGFKSVHVIYHKENVGQAANTRSIVEYAASKYDRYISSEDDNVFAYSFLGYMNAMLERYKDSDDVIYICGYSYPVKWIDDRNMGIVKEQSFYPAWGVATFFSKRNEVAEYYNNQYYIKDFKEKKLMLKLLRNNKFLFCHYIHNIWRRNRIVYNDLGVSLYQICKNKFCIMPVQSLVRNEGWDGSGVNCAIDDRAAGLYMNQKLNEADIDWFRLLEKDKVRHLEKNEKIINSFLKPTILEYTKGLIKLFLLSIGIRYKKKCRK